MINALGTLSDRLLGMVVPSTAAAACETRHYNFCEDCVSGMVWGRRAYTLSCTCGGYCYRSCTARCSLCFGSCR